MARLPISARLTFVGLWTYVDDNGVGVDNERLIAAAIWPLEEDPLETLRRLREDLRAISVAGLAVRYERDGRGYLFIASWDEHQKVSHPRKPRFPRPDEPGCIILTSKNSSPPESVGTTSGGSPENLQSPPETLRPEQGAGSREQGTSSRRKPAPSDASDQGNETSQPPRQDITRICDHLADRIRDNSPTNTRPAIGKEWLTDARLMLDRDKIAEAEIHRIIDWCQNDSFWRSNILSVPKLRKQFQQLAIKAGTVRRQAHVNATNSSAHHEPL